MILSNLQTIPHSLVAHKGPAEPPFWCPGGVSTSFLGFEGSHVARGAPQVDLLKILVVILEVIWSPKSINFGVDF